MTSKRGWLIATGLTGLALLIGMIVWLTSPASRTCHPREDDPQGYLFKICLYVQEKQIDVSPANPTEYHIKQIEERTEGNREVVWVFLSCCYLGDIAIIDKASGEVIELRVGAK